MAAWWNEGKCAVVNDRTPQSPVNSSSLIWVDSHRAPAAAHLSQRAAGARPASASCGEQTADAARRQTSTGGKVASALLDERGRDSRSLVRVGVTAPCLNSVNCIWCRCFPNQADHLFFAFPPQADAFFFFFVLVIKCTLLLQRVIAFDFEIDDATSPVRESNINHSQSYHIRGQTCFGTIDSFFFLVSSAVLLTLQMLLLPTNLYGHKLNWKRSFNESFESRPFRFAILLAVN